MLVIAFAAMIVMSVFVLPKFTGLYGSLAHVPFPHECDRVHQLHDQLLAVVLGVIAASIAIASAAILGGARGKSRRDSLAMKLPVIGNLFQLISLERFCRVWRHFRPQVFHFRSRSVFRPTAPTTPSSRRSMVRCEKPLFAAAVSTSRWRRPACFPSPPAR